tara:strand:+ start:160 stop:1284 length:1125 start_codon:yes stop_codon:yes gene_type:complete
MIKKIFKLLFAKKEFNLPERKRILILDKVNSHLLTSLINEKVNILATRYESINLLILLKVILKFRFTFNDYILEYIKYSGSSVIVSYIDNNLFYYKIKNFFPNIKIILIQNGMRTSHFFEKLTEIKNAKVDYLLTFSQGYKKNFEKSVNAKIIPVGSIRNNQINISKTKKEILSFISSGPLASMTNKVKIFQNKEISAKIYYNVERKLIPIIYNFCKEHDLKLNIICRSKNNKSYGYEKKFYEDILKNKDFILSKTFNEEDSYKLSDASVITSGVYSAFVLETVARGNKTAIFNARSKEINEESVSLFWQSKNILSRGSFWTETVDETEVKRTLKFCLNSTSDEWKSASEQIIPELINYDFENLTFRKLINDTK